MSTMLPLLRDGSMTRLGSVPRQAYAALVDKQEAEEERGPGEVDLLTEIRDALRKDA